MMLSWHSLKIQYLLFIYFFINEIMPHIAQDGLILIAKDLEIIIFHILPTQCWDHSHVLPHLILMCR